MTLYELTDILRQSDRHNIVVQTTDEKTLFDLSQTDDYDSARIFIQNIHKYGNCIVKDVAVYVNYADFGYLCITVIE